MKTDIVVLSALLCSSAGAKHHFYNEVNPFQKYIKNPHHHSKNTISTIEYQLDKFAKETQFMSSFESKIGCGMCSVAVKPIEGFFENKTIREGLDFIADLLCEHFKIYNGIPSVCKGAITIMAENLLPAIGEGVFSPQRICDEYLHLCSSPHIKELSADDFVKKRLADKPEFLKNNDFLDQVYEKIKASPKDRKTKRSIQLSDPHIDFKY